FDVEGIELAAGGTGGVWDEGSRSPRAGGGEERQTAGGGFVDHEAPGFGETRQHKGAGVGVPGEQLMRLEKAGAMDGMRQPECACQLVDCGFIRAVAAENEIPG